VPSALLPFFLPIGWMHMLQGRRVACVHQAQCPPQCCSRREVTCCVVVCRRRHRCVAAHHPDAAAAQPSRNCAAVSASCGSTSGWSRWVADMSHMQPHQTAAVLLAPEFSYPAALHQLDGLLGLCPARRVTAMCLHRTLTQTVQQQRQQLLLVCHG
jgi:hypothetical protein